MSVQYVAGAAIKLLFSLTRKKNWVRTFLMQHLNQPAHRQSRTEKLRLSYANVGRWNSSKFST